MLFDGTLSDPYPITSGGYYPSPQGTFIPRQAPVKLIAIGNCGRERR